MHWKIFQVKSTLKGKITHMFWTDKIFLGDWFVQWAVGIWWMVRGLLKNRSEGGWEMVAWLVDVSLMGLVVYGELISGSLVHDWSLVHNLKERLRSFKNYFYMEREREFSKKKTKTSFGEGVMLIRTFIQNK